MIHLHVGERDLIKSYPTPLKHSSEMGKKEQRLESGFSISCINILVTTISNMLQT